jgi:hypothetical protein
MSKQYLIVRNGEQAGPYTLEQIQQMQADGQLLPSDMAWTEGQTDWLPLSQIIGNTLPPSPPPAEEAKKTGKSPLVVRIILGVLLVAAIVIASLSWRANQQYRATYDKIADLRDDGKQDTMEGFHKIIGRKSDSDQDAGNQREEIYEWNAIIRKYQIRIKYFMVNEEKKMYTILDVSDESGSSEGE